MSWDKKARGGKYYYRSRRVAGKAVKVYVGRGPAAELAARLDERERQNRQAGRAARLAGRTQLAVADLAFADARALVDLLVQATLVLSGFHLHRNEWRRRGHSTQGS